jgi:Rhamnan synthesis protein F
MSQFRLRFPRAYRLRPVGLREEAALSLVGIGASNKSVLVPYSPNLEYVVASRGVGALPIESREFRVETLGPLPTLWARLRLAFLFKKRKFLKFDEFYLFSVGPKTERRRFTRYNRDMRNIGIEFDSELVGKHPEIVYGWPAEATSPSQLTNGPADAPVAVVAHIYYEDTWPDIAGALKGLTLPFDLIVTTVAGRERLIESVRRSYPRAQVEIMENRGRDIGPFLVLLERGRLDGYRYICKIHGKKSIDGGRETYMGVLWRRRLLFDLFGGAARCKRRHRHVCARPVYWDDRPESVPIAKRQLSRGSLLVGQSPHDLRACRTYGRPRGQVPTRFLRRNDVLGSPGGVEALEGPASCRRHALRERADRWRPAACA